MTAGSFRGDLASRQLFEDTDRSADVLFAIALGHRSLVKLLRQTRKHERDAELGTEVHGEANILLQPFHRKICGEVTLEDHGRLDGNQPRARRAVVQDVEHELGINTRLGAQHQTLVESLQQVAEDQVLRKLGAQAHARLSAVIQALAHGLEERFDVGKDLLLAANHEGERSPFRAGLRAGTGSIQEIDAQSLEFLCDAAALQGRDGAAIGDDEPFLRAFDQALLAQDHLPGHGGVSDAEKSTFTVLGNLRGSSAEQCARGIGEFLCLLLVMGPNRYAVAARNQMTGHRATHDAES